MAKNSTPVNTPDTDPRPPRVGKGVPTPTRKEREAARQRPLVPTDRKLAAKEARAKMSVARERARLGMAAGEERYLPERDKGAQRKFTRDYIDARFSVGEFMIPVMFVVIILTFLPSRDIQSLGILALWAFFFLAVADCIFLSFKLKSLIRKKFVVSDPQRGTSWYAAMRALQLRMMRLPKPQVKRGQYPR